MRDARAHYYAYRTTWQGRRQTGLACVASLAGYENGRIRKHELTTPVKETDRVRQIEALNAQTGPVMMAYPHAPEIDTLLKRATERDPDVAVTADDDVVHELWVIADSAPDRRAHARVRGASARSTSPTATTARRRPRACRRRAAAAPEGSHRYFLSVVFPHHAMTILDYNRVIRDLNGRTPEQLLDEIGATLRRHAGDLAGAADRGARVRHVPRPPLVSAEAAARAGAGTAMPSAACP